MKTMLVFLSVLLCVFMEQSIPHSSQQNKLKQECICVGPPSFIVMEDDLNVYGIPCKIPDTLTFYSESTGIERVYIFLDCKGSIEFQKRYRDSVIIVEGQFIFADSLVKIGWQPLVDDEESIVFPDTIQYNYAYYARKIGLWIYR